MKKLLWILLMFIIACATGKVKKNYPGKSQLSPKQLKLRKVHQKIELEDYETALELNKQFIENYPYYLSGYQSFVRLLQLTDKTSSQIKQFEQEYLNYLKNNNTPDSLYLQAEYLFATNQDSIQAQKLKKKLLTQYPNSSTSNSLAQEEIYDLIIERDDTLRIQELVKFLDEYGKTKWSPLAWKYLLYSYDQTGNQSCLDSVLTYIERNEFQTFKMKNLVTSYRTDRKDSLNKYLGIMNEIIGKVDSSGQKTYFDFLQMKSKDEILQQYNFTYIKILYKQDKFRQILSALKHLSSSKLDARLLYYKGRALEKLNNKEEAFSTFLQCAQRGDARTRWSLKADSLLENLHGELTDSKQNVMHFCRTWDDYEGAEFSDYTKEAGLDSIKASRVAWGDFNNDNFDDLLLDGRKLFQNMEGISFKEVSREVGIDNSHTSGGLWADIDRDGWLDFYAVSSSKKKEDKLWKNMNGKKFIDITEQSNLSDTLQTEGAAWGDIQGDLYPDLYVANYQYKQLQHNEPDFLFLNLGSGQFQDVSSQKKVRVPANQNQAGRGVNWGDFNNDGFLDIFVSNYRLDRNFLWENHAGSSFDNVASYKGVEGNYIEGWFGHTIGSDWGDFDNDGDLDLITANLAHPRYIKFSDKTMLYENIEQGKFFVDIREKAGISYDECHSDPTWFDANGDGFLDLYLTSIYPNRPSYLYQNNRDKTFTDITYLSQTRTTNSWGAATSDYDNDGDLDLIVCSREGIHLFRNETKIDNWLKIKVVDEIAKTAHIGSKILCEQNGMIQIREVQGGKGTTNQNSFTQFISFPASSSVKITVRFPDGLKKQRVVKNLERTIVFAHPGKSELE